MPIGAFDFQFPHFNDGPPYNEKETEPTNDLVADAITSNSLDEAQRGESFGFCQNVNDCQRVFNPDGSYSCSRCNITG